MKNSVLIFLLCITLVALVTGCGPHLTYQSLDYCTQSYGEYSSKKQACDKGVLLLSSNLQKKFNREFEMRELKIADFLKNLSEDQLAQMKSEVLSSADEMQQVCEELDEVKRKYEGVIPEYLKACKVGVSHFKNILLQQLNQEIKSRYKQPIQNTDHDCGNCWHVK